MSDEQELEPIDVTVSAEEYVTQTPPVHLDGHVIDSQGRDLGSTAPVILPQKVTGQLVWVFTPQQQEQ